MMLQIKELKSKLNEENSDQSNLSVKEETMVASESEITKLIVGEPEPTPPLLPTLGPKETNHSSDSDSSAILNDENVTSSSPSNAAISSSGLLQSQQHDPLICHPHYVKLEEHNFFGEETCHFFSDEQAPTLHWYCPDQWN